MSWLSSSLQRAGELLESVDQKASIKLKPRGTDERKKVKQEEVWELKQSNGGENDDEIQFHSSADQEVPTRSISSIHLAGLQDGRDADTFSEWSEVDNESNSGITMEEMPLSNSSSRSHLPPLPADMQTMKSETSRLRRENSKLKNDLSSLERQLSNSQEQLEVCQEELEALDKECMGKIESLEREVTRLIGERAGDEEQYNQALIDKDSHVQTLETELKNVKHLMLQQSNEVDQLKQTLAELTSTKEQAWTNAASGEAHLQQRLASLQSELKDALTQVASLKKENNETKQSMYARQCALEATNAELTNYVAKLEQSSQKPRSPSNGQRNLQQVQDTLASTKKLLHEESRKALLQSQEIAKLTQDMNAMQTLLVRKEQDHAAAIQTLQLELHEKAKASQRISLQTTGLSQTQMNHTALNDNQAMTRRLLEKQEQLDALRSRYTTLEVRYNEMKAAKEANDKNDDLELNIRSTRHHGQLNRSKQVHHKIPALEAADRMMLSVGRFLRAYPTARFALLLYLALLHLWAFVILSFHTSHLSEELHVKAKTP